MLERGFHFIVVLWGERFCDYFLEYCLPSMLSPNNIPALRTSEPSRFLIATRPEDWERMRSSAIFRRLEQYITPIYLEIPPCPPGRGGCEHMGHGHKLACEYAFQKKGYAVLVTPDSMLSDGTVARLQEHAQDGKKLVLAVALRFGEGPFLGNLKSAGLVPAESRRDTGTPLIISGREMSRAAVKGLHGETLSYEWDAPYLVSIPAAAWWGVPGEDGMVIHSISWAPMLIDYAGVASHDTSTFDNWTLDGDYIHRNVNWREATYIVQDSDEIFIASWGPMNDGPATTGRWGLLKHAGLRDLVHGAQIRRVYNSYFSDPMKRHLLFKTVRWHANPINSKWDPIECRAVATLRTYLTPPESVDAQEASTRPNLRMRGLKLLLAFWLGVFDPLWTLWVHRKSAAHRFAQIVRGDRQAFDRVFWHVRATLCNLLNLPFHERPPRPPV
jgi:hypothetical protein